MYSILFKFLGCLNSKVVAHYTNGFLWLVAVVVFQTAAQIIPHTISHLLHSTCFKLIIHSHAAGQLTLLRKDYNCLESLEKISGNMLLNSVRMQRKGCVPAQPTENLLEVYIPRDMDNKVCNYLL
jgi:hypothetical protein